MPERKRDFSSSSRQIKILTAGIHRVFRGLKFLFNEEIDEKGHFRSGTNTDLFWKIKQDILALNIIDFSKDSSPDIVKINDTLHLN